MEADSEYIPELRTEQGELIWQSARNLSQDFATAEAE